VIFSFMDSHQTGNRSDNRSEPEGIRRQARRSFGEGGEPRREGFEVMLRRFFREVQQSGILSEVKKRRFHEKPLSRGKKREIATRKAARRRWKRGY